MRAGRLPQRPSRTVWGGPVACAPCPRSPRRREEAVPGARVCAPGVFRAAFPHGGGALWRARPAPDPRGAGRKRCPARAHTPTAGITSGGATAPPRTWAPAVPPWRRPSGQLTRARTAPATPRPGRDHGAQRLGPGSGAPRDSCLALPLARERRVVSEVTTGGAGCAVGRVCRPLPEQPCVLAAHEVHHEPIHRGAARATSSQVSLVSAAASMCGNASDHLTSLTING